MPRRERISVAWDDRLDALTAEMRRCRSLRFHDWLPAGAEDVVRSRGKVVQFVQHWRCDRGCETRKTETMEVLGQAIRRLGNPKYDHDPRYKIVGEPVDTDLLAQQKYIDANPGLLDYLQANGRRPQEGDA